MDEVEQLRQQLKEQNQALLALEKEKMRANVKSILRAELILRGFDADAATGIGEQLAAQVESTKDGQPVHDGAIGERAIVENYLNGDGAYLKPLARNGGEADTGFDPARVAEPQYGAKWKEADPAGYEAAMNRLVADKAKIPPRRPEW